MKEAMWFGLGMMAFGLLWTKAEAQEAAPMVERCAQWEYAVASQFTHGDSREYRKETGVTTLTRLQPGWEPFASGSTTLVRHCMAWE